MATDLDKGGTGFHRSKVYLGPTLGWVDSPLIPARIITITGTSTIDPGDSVVLVDVAATVTVNLPDVVEWVKQSFGRPATGYERALWIKDLGGNATLFNITVHPFGGQLIDKSAANVVMNTNFQMIRLYPLFDLSGWYIESNAGINIPPGSIFDVNVNTAAAIQATKLNFLQAGTGAVNRTVQNKERDIFSVRDFGTVGDGVANDAPAINAALLAASVAGVSTVRLPSGTYRVTAPIVMQPNVTLLGDGTNSIIIQGNAANLRQVVDFAENTTATGATIRYCVVDGNRANNTGRLQGGVNERRLIYYGNIGFVTIDNCTLQNGPGYGAHGAACVHMRFTNNYCTNTEAHQFFLVNIGANFTADLLVANNYFDQSLLIGGIANFQVINNRFVGSFIGNVSAPMRVDVNGTAVTWVSGPNFASAKSGMLLIANNGTIQADIKQVNSNTSLTLNTGAGIVSNVLGMIGENDLLGALGVVRGIISDNDIRNGVSFGISLAGDANTKFEDVLISNNVMFFQGKTGFSLLGGGGGLGYIGAQNVSILGNTVVNACSGGLAGNPAGGGGLHSYVITEGSIDRILVDDNFAQDNLSNTFQWLSAQGLTAKVLLGQGNRQVGAQNIGVFNPAGVLQEVIATSIAITSLVDADVFRFTGPTGFSTIGSFGGTQYWQTNGIAMEVGTASAHGMTLRTNATARLTFDGAGNAGIATVGLKSSHATQGIGYATGAGGTVTQITSRATGVTLNTVSGDITLVSAAGSTTANSFTVTNSAVAATDTISINQKSGTDLYNILITNVAAGSFKVTFFTTGGTTTEQPVFHFNVIKGINS